jgi:assimilatory nitrate reductase catalytic subunit
MVFQILKEISRGQPCDITGIADYRAIDERGGIQWPWTEDDEARRSGSTSDPSSFRERRLFEDGRFFHADARARFCFEEPTVPPETIDAEFPFVLLTGRGSSSQWHTQTRTAKSDVLRKLSPAEVYVEINPHDAGNLSIAPNTLVKIRSRRAEIVATAFVTATVQPGQLFLPMHYAAVNQLTNSVFDPYSRQPSYKWTSVAIEPIEAATPFPP